MTNEMYAQYLNGCADGLNQGKQDTIAELERLKKEIDKIPYYQLRFEVPRLINRRIRELKGEQK